MLSKTNQPYSMIPVVLVVITGVFSVYFYPGTSYASAIMLIIAFAQNVSLSLVSNARNRNNTNYHLIASFLSNGVWFLTFAFLVQRDMSSSLFLPFLIGTTLGSLYGKSISQRIELRLKLSADATSDTSKTQGSGLFPKIFLIFVGIISLFYAHTQEFLEAALLLSGMSYIQNIGSSLGSRARNRGNHNYLIFATILSGIVWFVMFRELIKYNMSFVLFFPYIVSAIFGSLSGGFISIKIEQKRGFKPDEHVNASSMVTSNESLIQKWGLFVAVLVLGFLFLFIQTSSLASIFSLPKADATLLLLLLGMGLFVAETTFYTLADRAGTRDNFNYHLWMRLMNGSAWFFAYGYIISHGMSFELLIPILLGRTIGSILGQKMGIYFEKKIGAVMDVKNS